MEVDADHRYNNRRLSPLILIPKPAYIVNACKPAAVLQPRGDTTRSDLSTNQRLPSRPNGRLNGATDAILRRCLPRRLSIRH